MKRYLLVLLLALSGCGGGGSSTPEPVTPTPNRAPIAVTPSNLETLVESTIILDASGSTDADNDVLTYTWSFTSVPEGSAFSPSTPTTTELNRINFTPDVAGTYELTLIVSDGELSSNPVPLTIVVTTPNQPPVLTIETTNESYELMQLDLTFTVADDESLDLLNITIEGDDAEVFLIKDNAIFFNIVPDYETPADLNQDNEYTFTLNVSDGELSTSEQVTVTVLNVNEYTDNSSLPGYASGDFTRFITQDLDSGEEGTLTMSFAENNNVNGFLPPLNQDEVTLLWNWVFDGAESLIFGVIQNQPEDSQNGPLKEYFYREFEGETYCSNYVGEVCEPIEVLINNFELGYSISQNAFNYYQDSDFESTRELYSLNTLLTVTNDDDGIFISRLGNNEAYAVIAVNYERVFNNSTSTGLDSISGVFYIYPPLGIVGGVLSIDSANYFDSDYNIRFHIDNTNITSNP